MHGIVLRRRRAASGWLLRLLQHTAVPFLDGYFQRAAAQQQQPCALAGAKGCSQQASRPWGRGARPVAARWAGGAFGAARCVRASIAPPGVLPLDPVGAACPSCRLYDRKLAAHAFEEVVSTATEESESPERRHPLCGQGGATMLTINENEEALAGDFSNDPPRKLAVLGLPWDTRCDWRRNGMSWPPLLPFFRSPHAP